MTGTVLLIGATGTIGSAVARELSRDHDIIPASRTGGEEVDLIDHGTIEDLLERLHAAHGPLAGIVSCAGGGMLGRVDELDLDAFLPRMTAKVLGQIAVVKYGRQVVAPGGAIVLTSGVLEQRPLPGTSQLAVMNAALRAFALAAAVEPNGVRTCVVSPGLVEESPPQVLDLFPGMTRIAAAELAAAYRFALETGKDGETIDAWGVSATP